MDWWSPKHYPSVQDKLLDEGSQNDEESDDNENEGQINQQFTNRKDLHFNSDSGRYYFLDPDGQSRWHNEDDPIWDDSTGEWGYIRNMEWVSIQEQSRQSAASSSSVGESSQAGGRKSKGRGKKKA
jgi:hypothetical protein